MNPNLTLVVQGLAFFAVVWLVMKFGWPHIIGAIEERQNRIAEGLSQADKAREELRGKVAALAVAGAEKILRREIDANAHKSLLDQLVTEI
ncbi:MAG: hypothetical protein IT477_11415 [Rhodanobacteraceae bacterium]|nr:hypothetical protein [Rhodanobacteraceae bacterium]